MDTICALLSFHSYQSPDFLLFILLIHSLHFQHQFANGVLTSLADILINDKFHVVDIQWDGGHQQALLEEVLLPLLHAIWYAGCQVGAMIGVEQPKCRPLPVKVSRLTVLVLHFQGNIIGLVEDICQLLLPGVYLFSWLDLVILGGGGRRRYE